MAASASSSHAAAIINSVLENIKNLPTSEPSSAPPPSFHSSAPRFDSDHSSPPTSSYSFHNIFGRKKPPLHDLLGGGHSADVLLWRKKHLSATFLAVSTAIWVLFEWIGYHFVSLISFLLLATVVILFAWSNGSAFLSRAPPPIPTLELSEDVVVSIAKALTAEINRLLLVFRSIAVGNDAKRFARLVAALSMLVIFGRWFNFLSLAYFLIVAAHTLPVIYEKNEEAIDNLAQRALDELRNQLKKVDSTLLNKIPPAQKKME